MNFKTIVNNTAVECAKMARAAKRGTMSAIALTAAGAVCAAGTIQIPSGTNLGRQTLFVAGINGVVPGGQVQVNYPCDRRYHRIIYYCTAINFTGGAGLAATKVTSATGAAGLTVTLTVNASHVPTAVGTFGGTNSGWAVNDTFTVADATGAGILCTVTTVSSGAITAATVTVAGTPTAISPANFFTQFVQTVGGVNVRDLTPAQEIQRAQINPGFVNLPAAGQFPVFYTEPWRNLTRWPAITAWDMAGQTSFQHKLTLSPNLVTPGLVAIMEFDFMRNTAAGEIPQNVYNSLGNSAPPLQLTPITAHAFTQALGIGLNLINILPSNFPTTRLLLLGSVPGNITQLEIDKDGAKFFESYAGTAANAQLNESLQEYGFVTNIFDAMFIADVNQRVNQALKFLQPQGGLILRVWSSVVQNLTVIQEKLPGGYAS